MVNPETLSTYQGLYLGELVLQQHRTRQGRKAPRHAWQTKRQTRPSGWGRDIQWIQNAHLIRQEMTVCDNWVQVIVLSGLFFPFGRDAIHCGLVVVRNALRPGTLSP